MEFKHYVVFDANILLRDLWLAGESFQYLIKHRFLYHRPYVPAVVLQEVRYHIKSRAEELIANVKEDGSRSEGNYRGLRKLFNHSKECEKNKWDIDDLLMRWENNLLSIFNNNKGGVLPTIDIQVKELIDRSIDRRKPFSKGDKGFRDTLIWLSTLDLTGPLEHVSFITENKSDFFDKNTKEPASEIKEEIRSKLGEGRELIIHLSIDDFVTTFDSDRSTSESALQRALISDEMESFSLWRWIEMNLEELTKDYEFDLIHWAGCPEDAEAPMLIKLEKLVCLDVGVVCHDKDDIYRVYCDIGIVGIFECTVGCNKVNNIVHPNQTLRAYEDDKEYWSKVKMRSVATFILRLDFNVSTSHVESAYILPLEHWKSYKDTMQSIDDKVEELELDDALL